MVSTMADWETLPTDVRNFLSTYHWHAAEPMPWAPMETPLLEARVGLVVMACMTAADQPPFDADQPGNDPSLRVVPSDMDPSELVNTFPGQAFDHAGLAEDANLLVPLDRMRELVEAGEIGEFSPRTVSICGHLPKPERFIKYSAPEIARLFADDGADAVLLVPA
jgi:D-proline reductase (dithiol) PrdB